MEIEDVARALQTLTGLEALALRRLVIAYPRPVPPAGILGSRGPRLPRAIVDQRVAKLRLSLARWVHIDPVGYAYRLVDPDPGLLTWRAGPITVDLRSGRTRVGDHELVLESETCGLLATLVRRQGRRCPWQAVALETGVKRDTAGRVLIDLQDALGSVGDLVASDERGCWLQVRAGLTVGPLEIDMDGGRAVLHGRDVRLSPAELELLARLAQDAGAVVPDAVLLRDVWPGSAPPTTRAIIERVSRLRVKLGDEGVRIGRERKRGACLYVPNTETHGLGEEIAGVLMRLPPEEARALRQLAVAYTRPVRPSFIVTGSERRQARNLEEIAMRRIETLLERIGAWGSIERRPGGYALTAAHDALLTWRAGPVALDLPAACIRVRDEAVALVGADVSLCAALVRRRGHAAPKPVLAAETGIPAQRIGRVAARLPTELNQMSDLIGTRPRGGLWLKVRGMRTAGPLTVDYDAYRVVVDGRDVRLSALEFELVARLSLRPGTVVDDATLLRDVWLTEPDGSSVSRVRIADCVWKAQEKLGDDVARLQSVSNRAWVLELLASPRR